MHYNNKIYSLQRIFFIHFSFSEGMGLGNKNQTKLFFRTKATFVTLDQDSF